MPIYEYECEECGRIEEALQKFSDEPLTTCRHCSGSLHKLISQSAFHLKGGGWYVTDYANKSSQNASGSSKSKGENSSGSETKPASEQGKKSKATGDKTT